MVYRPKTSGAEPDGRANTLVNDREQGKFAAIERLLGHPVTKAMVPEQFGEVPAYDPKSFKHHKPDRKKFGKFKGRKNGRKPMDNRR